MFLHLSVILFTGGLCPGGLCLGGLCPGGLYPGVGLCRGGSLSGRLPSPPAYSYVRVERILLECILVLNSIKKTG